MNHGNMQMDQMGKDGKPLPSPRDMSEVDMNGTTVKISYGAPSLRGRKMIGDHDPYGQVWRLGANEATSFVTNAPVMVGGTLVPAGSYTLFALPTANNWTLIISKKTGEWGIPYPGEQFDFARVPMMKGKMSAPVERLKIDFTKVRPNRSELHVKWGTDNYWVPVDRA